jgi:signal transduction histidine kinase
MRGFWVPVVSAEPAARRGRAISGAYAQPVAAVAALLVLMWALSDGFWPTWPLWTIAGLLVLGLFAGPVARLAGGGPMQWLAQPVAAVAALLVLTFWLPNARASWHVSPPVVIAFLLGLGLVADPIARLVGGQPVHRSAPPIAAIVAILVLLRELAVDSYFFYTASPGIVHTFDRLPLGALRVVVVLLSLGLIAGQPASRPAVRRYAPPAAAVAALLVLLFTLVSSPAGGIRPEWPLWCMAALLGLGIVADPLAGRPGAKALAERVDELSRTRSGALDVQATEMRRIERDLHDGAQVRLVALSMKLGRAEDRYRDDPETAALLREAREDATAAIRELRGLARGIAPPVLASRGLAAAVRSLAQRSGAEVIVSGELKRRPLPPVETAAYFVIAESLTNAVKHAPGARVEIRLEEHGDDVFVEIVDFGPGDADPAGGGLTGLRQRVEALDGVLSVTSPPGVGTQIEAVIPCGR